MKDIIRFYEQLISDPKLQAQVWESIRSTAGASAEATEIEFDIVGPHLKKLGYARMEWIGTTN